MALVGQIVVESRRYSGWVDPRFPIGFWQAALSVTGDATGGLLAIDLVFQSAFPVFLNSQMYSVERLGVVILDGVSRSVNVEAVNMAGPANQPFLQRYSFNTDVTTGLGRTSIRANQLGILPWFLGSQREAGTTASLSLVTDNVDTIAYTFEAEGYRWSARSVLIDGGPQRPPTGLYRR